MSDTEKKIHQGRNVKRFREMLGLKQEGLGPKEGIAAGSKEEMEPALLEQVAKVMKVPEKQLEILMNKRR